jgi:hypothetical protein
VVPYPSHGRREQHDHHHDQTYASSHFQIAGLIEKVQCLGSQVDCAANYQYQCRVYENIPHHFLNLGLVLKLTAHILHAEQVFHP